MDLGRDGLASGMRPRIPRKQTYYVGFSLERVALDFLGPLPVLDCGTSTSLSWGTIFQRDGNLWDSQPGGYNSSEGTCRRVCCLFWHPEANSWLAMEGTLSQKYFKKYAKHWEWIKRVPHPSTQTQTERLRDLTRS